jgi:hypothetical protein
MMVFFNFNFFFASARTAEGRGGEGRGGEERGGRERGGEGDASARTHLSVRADASLKKKKLF